MLNDFKKFIARGNVLDLAIAVIMGAAFGSVIKTFTDGIIMPVVGLLTGGIDFKQQYWDIGGKLPANATPEQLEEAMSAGAPVILYGQLFSDILTFIIVAVVMFFLARYAVNLFKGLEAEAAQDPQEVLLTEIRDILKNK